LEESAKTVQDPKERKEMEDALAGTKVQLERMAADEQRLQSREIDAETQLRTEQNRLADLQDQLDRLDKLLDSLSKKQP
jgi:chromosome segregation ATPase